MFQPKQQLQIRTQELLRWEKLHSWIILTTRRLDFNVKNWQNNKTIHPNCSIIIFIDLYEAILWHIRCVSFFNFTKDKTWIIIN